MAHRYYNITTCVANRKLCFEALRKKIEMVKWEHEHGLITNFESGLSQEIKELLENHIVRVSDEASALLQDGTIWAEWFKQSADFAEKSAAIKQAITSNEPINYGTWKYFNKDKVTWDHTVPTTVLVNRIIKLYDEGLLSVEAYSELVEKYGFVTLITKKENEALNKEHLRQSMPEGWEFGLDADPFCRYRVFCK